VNISCVWLILLSITRESTEHFRANRVSGRNRRLPPFQIRELCQVIPYAHLIEDAAEAAQGDAVAVRAAEAAELAAALDVRLQVEEEARDAALPQRLGEGRKVQLQVAEESAVVGAALVGGAEVRQCVLVHVPALPRA